ncbi:MAG: RagB/SusD family nutrient uptake outer membrane protein [Allomuricauda sp.]
MKHIKFKKKVKIALTTVGMLLLAFVPISITSCSDEILNKQPIGDIAGDDIFNDEGLLEAYVLGSYRAFRFFQFGAFFTEGSTDNAVNVDGGAWITHNRGETTADNGEEWTRNAWRENYTQIRRINLYFDRIDGSSVSPELTEKLTAEMRFIRAWCYFDLIGFYGGVPLVTELFELGQESFDGTRASYDEVSAFIVNELDLAIPNLPEEAFDGQTGRATRGAAMALKSRALLYAASPLNNPSNDMVKWQAASDAAEAAMNLSEYGIDPDYSNLYNETRSMEVMFGRGYTFENPANFVDSFGWNWNFIIDRYYLPRGYFASDPRFIMPIQDLVDAYETLDGSPVDPQDPWTNRDPRLDMTIIHHNSLVTSPDGPVTIEYHQDAADPNNADLSGLASAIRGGTQSQYNILKQTQPEEPLGLQNPNHLKPWIYFRLAEMYLNYAEAQIALGNEDNARNAINTVRARANVNMPPLTDSGSDLVQRYRNERRIEFAFENLRWYDITRWQIGSETLTDTAYGITVLRDNSVSPSTDMYIYNDRIIDGLRTWNDNMALFPIPRTEIEASQNLEQNPGY